MPFEGEEAEERYSRLRVFSFADFTKLHDKRAVIVGIGGLGVIVSEIMVRCGIGRMAIFDYDSLELGNMNRMVFKPSQVGMKKVDAMKEYLAEINPDVEVLAYPNDVTDGEGYSIFNSAIKNADIVFSCVDSFDVRVYINKRCVLAGKPLIDGGASINGVNGSVHTVIPGKTPCYRCHMHQSDALKKASDAPAKTVDETKAELELQLDDDSQYIVSVEADGKDVTDAPVPAEASEPEHVTGTCHFTSLPTTMGIIASLQCQEAFKHMLGFGSVAPYLIYRGMDGVIERIDWQINPSCKVCGKTDAALDKKGEPEDDGSVGYKKLAD